MSTLQVNNIKSYTIPEPVRIQDSLSVSGSTSITGSLVNMGTVNNTKLTGSFTGSFVGGIADITTVTADTLTINKLNNSLPSLTLTGSMIITGSSTNTNTNSGIRFFPASDSNAISVINSSNRNIFTIRTATTSNRFISASIGNNLDTLPTSSFGLATGALFTTSSITGSDGSALKVVCIK